jgi:hypothetical protein
MNSEREAQRVVFCRPVLHQIVLLGTLLIPESG